jgi:hypothetical protein
VLTRPAASLLGQEIRLTRALARQAVRPYPKLWEAFKGHDQEAGIIARLERLSHDRLAKASATLAKEGKEKALAIIWPTARVFLRPLNSANLRN